MASFNAAILPKVAFTNAWICSAVPKFPASVAAMAELMADKFPAVTPVTPAVLYCSRVSASASTVPAASLMVLIASATTSSIILASAAINSTSSTIACCSVLNAL